VAVFDGRKTLADKLLLSISDRHRKTFQSKDLKIGGRQGNFMLILSHIKITPRDREVLQLLMEGCSNKEIAAQLNISPRTVKQHLRTLFLRAGIRDGRKRVKLATAMFAKEQMTHATT
jgi:DNA-binding NarL/FixJ family response regulator